MMNSAKWQMTYWSLLKATYLNGCPKNTNPWSTDPTIGPGLCTWSEYLVRRPPPQTTKKNYERNRNKDILTKITPNSYIAIIHYHGELGPEFYAIFKVLKIPRSLNTISAPPLWNKMEEWKVSKNLLKFIALTNHQFCYWCACKQILCLCWFHRVFFFHLIAYLCYSFLFFFLFFLSVWLIKHTSLYKCFCIDNKSLWTLNRT